MTHDEPECSHDTLTPCSVADWKQCDRCHRVVCLVHDELYPIFQSGELEFYMADMLCSRCVENGKELGDWSSADFAQWVNFR
jgi:hypothetical protein